jgi:dipeptidyl aminopeptidase/acylaminoacyl peptidase
LTLLLATPAWGDDAAPYQLRKDTKRVPSQPYRRYFTTDRFGRTITFYLSEVPKDAPAKLPLVVYIQGSGCQSNFGQRDGRVFPQNGHATVGDAVRGRARLLIVEKPGVKFLDTPQHPGGTEGASEEFLREHTLERWAEAVAAAIKATRTLPEIDPSRTLVIGHSEGGLVACKVAADNPFVTHVASLAGGGPTQLFDLVELARAGKFAANVSDDPDVRARSILHEFEKIKADPESTTKMFLGHPYRRWSSFFASSPMEELARTSARIYIAQGGADDAVLPTSFHALDAQLVARGKDVTADFVIDADHSFTRAEDKRPPGAGWTEVIERVVASYVSG